VPLVLVLVLLTVLVVPPTSIPNQEIARHVARAAPVTTQQQRVATQPTLSVLPVALPVPLVVGLVTQVALLVLPGSLMALNVQPAHHAVHNPTRQQHARTQQTRNVPCVIFHVLVVVVLITPIVLLALLLSGTMDRSDVLHVLNASRATNSKANTAMLQPTQSVHPVMVLVPLVMALLPPIVLRVLTEQILPLVLVSLVFLKRTATPPTQHRRVLACTTHATYVIPTQALSTDGVTNATTPV